MHLSSIALSIYIVNFCIIFMTELVTDLNDIWSFYFHDPNDSNWNYDSYVKLCDVSTVQEFTELNHLVKSKLYGGIFFLMREYVFPCWDDENNVKGGCLSLKISNDEVKDIWTLLAYRLLGETLLIHKDTQHPNEMWNHVNGISISPKRYYCIVKVWMKDVNINDRNCFRLPLQVKGEVLFKTNQSSIDGDIIRHTSH
jgi:hypothetical protein